MGCRGKWWSPHSWRYLRDVWMDMGLMDIHISLPTTETNKSNEGHLRGIGTCFICTGAIYIESNLFSFAATVVRIQSVNGHFQFNLKNVKEKANNYNGRTPNESSIKLINYSHHLAFFLFVLLVN